MRDPRDEFGETPIGTIREEIRRVMEEAETEGRDLTEQEALLEAIFGKKEVIHPDPEIPNAPGQAVYSKNPHEINKKGEQIAGQAAEKASYARPDESLPKRVTGTTYRGGSLLPPRGQGPGDEV